MAIKEWNDGEDKDKKEETLQGPLFNHEEIKEIK